MDSARLPEWMAIKPANTEKYSKIKSEIAANGLHTVCAEAHCPNISECWGGGTATFMVLGDLCTRGCRFCSVPKSAAGRKIDADEPAKLSGVIKKWGLKYVVVTSVCRDDLEDQGSFHFAKCVEEIRKANPGTTIELLIPDFRNDDLCLKRITDSSPEVIGHNIETVERLTSGIRDKRATYFQSIEILSKAKRFNPRIYTKSAIMLGLGESESEVEKAMDDLRAAGVDFLAMGQYLRPSKFHAEVKEFIKPEKFARLKKLGLEKGFLYVAAGPFVRSSYRADEVNSLIKYDSPANSYP